MEYEVGGGWHDWSPDGDFIVYNAENTVSKKYQILAYQMSTGNLWMLFSPEKRSLLGPVLLHHTR